MERRDILLVPRCYLNFPPKDDYAGDLRECPAEHAAAEPRGPRPPGRSSAASMVDGLYQDGSLSISFKVETLEDGLLGQTVRVRNPKTRRELYGKVQNDQTVLISL